MDPRTPQGRPEPPTTRADRLSPADRLAELAALLATGLLRLRQRQAEQSHCSQLSTGEFGLDVIARQSVHDPATTPEVEHGSER